MSTPGLNSNTSQSSNSASSAFLRACNAKEELAYVGLSMRWQGLTIDHMKVNEYTVFRAKYESGRRYKAAAIVLGVAATALGGTLLGGGAYFGYFSFSARSASPGYRVAMTLLGVLQNPLSAMNEWMQAPLSTSVSTCRAFAGLTLLTIVAPIAAVIKGPFLMLRGLSFIRNPKESMESLCVGKLEAGLAHRYANNKNTMGLALNKTEDELDELLKEFVPVYKSDKANRTGERVHNWIFAKLWPAFNAPFQPQSRDSDDESD